MTFSRFEYFAKDIDHLRAPHRHHFYTFILVTDGSGGHEIDFHKYELKPNRLFLIAPDQVHAWNDLNSIKGFVVLFNDSFVALAKGRKLMSGWPLFRPHLPSYKDLTIDERNRWVEELKLMEQEISSPDDFSRDSIFYSIGKLLVRTSRLYQNQAPLNNESQDFLFTFQEQIEKHFLELRAPKEYAALLNITPNHLNSQVKRNQAKRLEN
ncbi:MAG: AraC family ligand binding domain-containing protein [Cytophagales bacterium]|nr:AraC family ligand binding domain-containing protein [Cytophagales bacterium]